MKFIELTMRSNPTRRLLLNIDNIASIYSIVKSVSESELVTFTHVTVIQEITSADNYWEVTETIDEVIALIDERTNPDKKGVIR